jgi:hypothetical protein
MEAKTRTLRDQLVVMNSAIWMNMTKALDGRTEWIPPEKDKNICKPLEYLKW